MASELVGCTLHVDAGTDGEVRARIVEVEAYLGEADPASHAARGPTPRASIMFGAPGHLYVYLSYGMHHCANVVTERTGRPGAVLLRAAALERGHAVVRRRRDALRGVDPSTSGSARLPDAALLRGPGNLCRGLGLNRADNGGDLCAAQSRVQVWGGAPSQVLRCGPRIGIRLGRDAPLRFWCGGDAAVSGPRR